MSPEKSVSWAESVYRLLLRAYPRHYRSRFAAAMLDTFLRDLARVRATRPGSLVPFWTLTLVQAVAFGLCERCARPKPGEPMPFLETDLRFHGSILTDGRYALRQLARSPAFVATSVASLAIGIAAATTLFALADALFLRPVSGIREADQVVGIERTTFGNGYGTLSYPIYEHLRDHTRTLQSIAATTRDPEAFSLSDGETSQRVYGTVVSKSFFDVLKLRPALGRFFQAEEDAVPDAEAVVVLSHRLWTERFQAAPEVLDRPVRINNVPFTVVGVVEAGFEGTTAFSTDLWVPMAMAGAVRGEQGAELLAAPGTFWHRALGRLRPGVTPAAAQAELATLLDAFRADTPEVPAGLGIRVEASGRLPPPARPAFATFVGIGRPPT